ncbi:P-loop containing nucleoside triphosphate hydrolase protein [Gymnopilus junonius]|uniref:P-loop containing nucleoside triphosphate hydrolase protein n=1 Tax=Gymnopilus junonius TaxID=109634 RepID=A0A9P5TMK1_GYMJU|nr:P-loop containing nucleoside triphosphate hydrolase protein [Gymnopilus junonius]
MPAVQHTRLGLWDLYEDTSYNHSPPREFWAVYVHAVPFVWRMVCEIVSIRQCSFLLVCYVLVLLLSSVVPAIALSYSGQLLSIVQSAVEHRSIDTRLLVSVVFGTFLSSSANHLLVFASRQISRPLQKRIKLHYSVHIFRAFVRLDVPTFHDPAVQRQLEQSFPSYQQSTMAFTTIVVILNIVTTAIQLASQFFVLVRLLRDQTDGPLLAFLCFLLAFYQRPTTHKLFLKNRVWAATTRNEDYLRSEGLKQVASNPVHRQEIVASGIAPFLLAQYRDIVTRLSTRAGDFYDVVFDDAGQGLFRLILFPELLRSLPELIFAIRAVQQPASIPLSLASLTLITQTSRSFAQTAFALVDETDSIADTLSKVVQLYEVAKIPNRVKVAPSKNAEQHDIDDPDDPLLGRPFPEDQRTLQFGISVEFRKVSFKYPGSEICALHNISFKSKRGNSVIVGNNGSGKSTILKLISRLYDPTEGQILIDGIDIKTIRLADLRRSISVLFQDYSLFPLSIKDNIGLDTFIERLPDNYDTYLDRPVQDYYSGLPEGSTNAHGLPVDYSRVREAARIQSAESGGSAGNRGVSGGQMQRIALSRTFMRSVVSEESVGLLLFDEPSASLDPAAEHDLFERLRKLRGNKTMIFSSHRFGNLTRHADLILYMDDSKVVEEGTHDQLIRKNGEYAHIWDLQARAFL